MFVHWLSSGIYFGSPRGFRTDEQNEEIGFNTEVYSTSEVISFLSVNWEIRMLYAVCCILAVGTCAVKI